MTNINETCNQPVVDVFVADRELLIALACRIVDSRAVAEELVQESWIRWQGRDYRASDARPILRRIVSNLAKDWRRSNTAEQSALGEVHAFYATAPSSESALIAKNELLLVIRTLGKMSARHRRAFRLRTLEGRTYKEIGARLGLSISHARNLVEQVIVEIVLVLDA
ncbi:MAG: RNA polymerase sigma factor [Pseudomonadota bacterium]